MNRKISFAAAVTASLLLSACGMDIDNLRPVSDGSYITVDKEYVRLADISAPACKWLVTYRVAPGKYNAVYYGEGGTFYRAPPKLLRLERREMSCPKLENSLPPVEYTGGIFIPDDPEKPALLYRYLSDQKLGNAPGDAVGVAFDQEQAKPQAMQNGVAATAIGGAAVGAMMVGIEKVESDNLMFLADQAKDQSLRAVILR